MPDRLQLDDNLFPVQAFFNAVGDTSFIQMVGYLTQGIGYSSNEAHCTFPSDLDPGDNPFEGVQFSIFEEQVTINLSDLFHYLSTACNVYARSHPTHRQELDQYLQQMRCELTGSTSPHPAL